MGENGAKRVTGEQERGCACEREGGKEHVTYKLYGRGLNLNMSIVYYIVVVFCFIQL